MLLMLVVVVGLVFCKYGNVYICGDSSKYFAPTLVTGNNGSFLKHHIVKVCAGAGFYYAIDKYGRVFAFGKSSRGF